MTQHMEWTLFTLELGGNWTIFLAALVTLQQTGWPGQMEEWREDCSFTSGRLPRHLSANGGALLMPATFRSSGQRIAAIPIVFLLLHVETSDWSAFLDTVDERNAFESRSDKIRRVCINFLVHHFWAMKQRVLFPHQPWWVLRRPRFLECMQSLHPICDANYLRH